MSDPDSGVSVERLSASTIGQFRTLHDGDDGWCQAWRRDEFDKIASQFGVEKDAGAWMIGCVLIKPPFRGQGVARQALRLIVEDLRRRGATSIDAFPKRQAGDAGELWNGPESTYLGLGFRVAKDDPKRPLLRLSFS
jgi:GNAT superfamily N-acetyltransferase